VVSVSPIYASFDVRRANVLRYLSRESRASRSGLARSRNEDGFSREARSHPSITSSTRLRHDRVRARFDNAELRLVPGLYARIKVGGGTPHPHVLIDDAAIGTDQDKSS